MLRPLFAYGVRLFDALAILLIVLAGAALGCWLLRRRWQARENRLAATLIEKERRIWALERDLGEARARFDPIHLKALREGLQSAVAHEFVKGLDSILHRCQDVLDELGQDQLAQRDRLTRAITQAYELVQHAQNVVGLFGLRREELTRELVNPRALLEGVLKDLFPYAEAQGVTLRPSLASLEPVQLNRHLIAQVFSNVIHNAIKYSPRGAAVDVTLCLTEDGRKRLCVEVRDRGRGIAEEDWQRIFELRTRADGTVEPGSGIGLYYAREVARLHGGDVILVESRPGEGATFRIELPCD